MNQPSLIFKPTCSEKNNYNPTVNPLLLASPASACPHRPALPPIRPPSIPLRPPTTSWGRRTQKPRRVNKRRKKLMCGRRRTQTWSNGARSTARTARPTGGAGLDQNAPNGSVPVGLGWGGFGVSKTPSEEAPGDVWMGVSTCILYVDRYMTYPGSPPNIKNMPNSDHRVSDNLQQHRLDSQVSMVDGWW